jgi:uncharacterized protein
MMHPWTELRFINADMGFGVFATRPLPAGTITYVQDPLDVSIDKNQYERLDPLLKAGVDHYAFVDQDGNRVLCWDHAKYVNHCCHPNTISTGYGFEIAVRDIAADEQITDEYGLFNLAAKMEVSCGRPDCRKSVVADDISRYHVQWDAAIIAALALADKVPQDLIRFLEPEIKAKVFSYIAGTVDYIPVLNTRYQK